MNLGANESFTEESEASDESSALVQENHDLKRQVVLLHQKMEEKDRAIHILQQQLAQALHAGGNSSKPMSKSLDSDSRGIFNPIQESEFETKKCTNAATQTDRTILRPTSSSLSSRTTSEDDGLGPTVR